MEEQVQSGQRKKSADHANGAHHRIALEHHQDGRGDGKGRKKEKR
jgi:hypothetical protein